jgi:hypothetical protein
MRKEEGATAAASHLPSLSWLLRQAGPAAFLHGVIQTIGRTPLTTENVLLTNERTFEQTNKCSNKRTFKQTPAIFRHLIVPKQMTNETKKMQLSLRTD